MLRISIPSPTSLEAMICYLLTVLLWARTLLSIVIADVAGRNAQNLVSTNWPEFIRGVRQFALLTIPAAAVNAGLKWSTSMLSIRIRYRLSMFVNNIYLRDKNYYKATQLPSIWAIDHADQRVTADIAHFASAISELYSSFSKPLLDVVIYTYSLAQRLGWQGPYIMYTYFFLSSCVKRLVMPSLGRLVAAESALEGRYRTAHQRIIAAAEEIAFYNGADKERAIVTSALRDLHRHQVRTTNLQFGVGVVDQLLVKYWATIAGYLVLLSPFVFQVPGLEARTPAEFTRDYIVNGQYLTNMSKAVGDLVLVYNKLAAISGYVRRVSDLLSAIDSLAHRGNRPFPVRSPTEEPTHASFEAAAARTAEFLRLWKEKSDRRQALLRKELQTVVITGTPPESADGSPTPPPTIEAVPGGDIELRGVDLVSPDGTVLARGLTFEVRRGHHVMVTGRNGCGKSSLFRVIGELWPLQCGYMRKPPASEILFVPQRPYLVMGTLRDQIIYPHTVRPWPPPHTRHPMRLMRSWSRFCLWWTLRV